MPDSVMPLLRAAAPTLLLAAGGDALCPLVALRSAAAVMTAPDVRLVVAEVRVYRDVHCVCVCVCVYL